MRFPTRARLVAGLLLVAYLGLFATPVMAEKTRSTPFKIGNMSANAIARTPTVTSLVDKLSTPPARGFLSSLFFWKTSSAKAVKSGQVEAPGTNAQIHTKRVASVLKEIETPNPEASLLLDLLGAGESSCRQEDNITRDSGNGNAGGKDATSTLDSYSLGSCSEIYDLCFESCSVGKGIFKKKNKPAEGSCHVVCTVAQEGCQSCSKKQCKRSMITILQGFVRVVSTAVYWTCCLLAVITCCVGTIAWLVFGLFYSGSTMPLLSWAESWLPPAILVVIFNPFVVMSVIAWSVHRAWLDPSSVLLKSWQFISSQAPFSAALLGWAVHVSYIRRQMDRLRQEVQRSVYQVHQDVDGQVYIAPREAVVALRDRSARRNTRGTTDENTTNSAQINCNDNGGDIVNDSGKHIDHNADNDHKDLSDDSDNADNDTTDHDDDDIGNGNSNHNDTTDNDDDSSNNNDSINTDQEGNDNNNNDNNDTTTTTATATANNNENDNNSDNITTSTDTNATNDGANEENEE